MFPVTQTKILKCRSEHGRVRDDNDHDARHEGDEGRVGVREDLEKPAEVRKRQGTREENEQDHERPRVALPRPLLEGLASSHLV